MDTLFGEGQSGLKVVLFVIVVLGLLALAFWLLRRFGGGRLSSGCDARTPIGRHRPGNGRQATASRPHSPRQCGTSAHHRRSEGCGGGAEHRARGNRASGNRPRTSARHATGPPRRRQHLAAPARTGASGCSGAAQAAHGLASAGGWRACRATPSAAAATGAAGQEHGRCGVQASDRPEPLRDGTAARGHITPPHEEQRRRPHGRGEPEDDSRAVCARTIHGCAALRSARHDAAPPV